MAQSEMPEILKKLIPVSWDEMSRRIINGKSRGVPETQLPNAFEFSPRLIEVSDQMLVRRTPQEEEEVERAVMTGAIEFPTEVARALIEDKVQQKIIIEDSDAGMPIPTLFGTGLLREPVEDEVGDAHTHPIDAMASSQDIISILTGRHVIGIVITPLRVFSYIRTDKTPLLKNPTFAWGYINQIGLTKGRLMGEVDPYIDKHHPELASLIREQQGWELNYEGFGQLHIACYESTRQGKHFVRMT